MSDIKLQLQVSLGRVLVYLDGEPLASDGIKAISDRNISSLYKLLEETIIYVEESCRTKYAPTFRTHEHSLNGLLERLANVTIHKAELKFALAQAKMQLADTKRELAETKEAFAEYNGKVENFIPVVGDIT